MTSFAPRTSVKQLIIDPNDFLASPTPALNTSTGPSTATATATNLFGNSVLTESTLGAPSSSALPTDTATSQPTTTSATSAAADKSVDSEGGYWMYPSYDVLRTWTQAQLKAVEDFEVRFRRPVDLTAFGSLSAIAGHVVVFDRRMCTVYPDEATKHDVGKGLNVPAQVTLERCWVFDRATRRPIIDPSNPRYQQHLKRLKQATDTEFIEFDAETGVWVFRVEHFSRYGLEDGDDDEDMDMEMRSIAAQKAAVDITERKQEAYTPAKKAISNRVMDGVTPQRRVTFSHPLTKEKSISFELSDDSMSGGASKQAKSPFDLSASQSSFIDMSLDAHRLKSIKVPLTISSDEEEEIEEDEADEDDATGDDEVESMQGTEESGPHAVSSPSSTSSTTTPSSSSYATTKSINDQQRRLQTMRTSLFASTPSRPDDMATLDFTQKSLFKRPSSGTQLSMATIVPHPQHGIASSNNNVKLASSTLLKRSAMTGSTLDQKHTSHTWERQSRASFQHQSTCTSGSVTRKYMRIKYEKSMIFARTNCLVDAGLTMGRSFRVGWGPGGLLVHSGRLVQTANLMAQEKEKTKNDKDNTVDGPGIVRLQYIPLLKDDKILEQKRHRLTLEIQRRYTRIDLDEHGCPTACIEKDMLFEVFTKQIRYAATGLDTSIITRQELLIWMLGQVLFDPIESTDEMSDTGTMPATYQARIYKFKRKRALIQWLETAVESTTLAHVQRHLVEGNDTGAIFAFLTGLQVEKACELAMQQRDYRLATLLPQLGGDADFRADMDEQLTRWRDYDFEIKLSTEHRRIYELLRGNVGISAVSEEESNALTKTATPSTRQAPPLNIVEGLDWRRVFGMHLLYDIYDDMSIADAVSRYDAACAGKYGDDTMSIITDRTSVFYVAEPLPWYRPVETAASITAYALEDALLPTSYSPAMADYRISWQLHCILTHQSIMSKLALQLEQINLWEWAIFVLLFITDDHCRAKALYDVLARHVTLAAGYTTAAPPLSLQEQFVVDQLQVPRTWIYRAKALLAKRQHDHLAEVNCWIEADEHRLAHQLTMQHLAPEYIIQGK
ncbi:nuclear protein 96-domain-containing protein [Syncephalis fuscata]|nr:nuclear protein 96-domain-containing protein [Syncephalis fuscata]